MATFELLSPSHAVPVSITAQPSDTTVLVNNNATFTCLAYGTSPIDVTWFRMASGGEVGSAPTRIDDSQVIRSEVGTTEVTVTSTLTLASVWTGDDGAVFYCEVTNNLTEAGVFSNQSDSVTLTVQCMLNEEDHHLNQKIIIMLVFSLFSCSHCHPRQSCSYWPDGK